VSTGFEMNVECQLCDCEAPPVTLRRYGLWAATPTEARSAYSISFLKWAESMMVTSHVSLRAFIEVVRFQNGLDHYEVSKIGMEERPIILNNLVILVLLCQL